MGMPDCSATRLRTSRSSHRGRERLFGRSLSVILLYIPKNTTRPIFSSRNEPQSEAEDKRQGKMDRGTEKHTMCVLRRTQTAHQAPRVFLMPSGCLEDTRTPRVHPERAKALICALRGQKQSNHAICHSKALLARGNHTEPFYKYL
jgi:hypothetical protein